MILGSVFANGLSRYGSRFAFDSASINNSMHDPARWVLKSLPKAPDYYSSLLSNKPRHNAILPAPANSDHINMRMDVRVVGYAWYASSFSEYLAIAVVLIYMILALAHTIWVLITGVTSSSWDTVTELLALALRSPIPDALEGSGAGIESLGTYRQMVRLRIQGKEGDEKVVMVLDGEKRDETNGVNGREARQEKHIRIEVDGEYL